MTGPTLDTTILEKSAYGKFGGILGVGAAVTEDQDTVVALLGVRSAFSLTLSTEVPATVKVYAGEGLSDSLGDAGYFDTSEDSRIRYNAFDNPERAVQIGTFQSTIDGVLQLNGSSDADLDVQTRTYDIRAPEAVATISKDQRYVEDQNGDTVKIPIVDLNVGASGLS